MEYKYKGAKLSSPRHCNSNSCALICLQMHSCFCLALVVVAMARQQHLMSKFLYDGRLS